MPRTRVIFFKASDGAIPAIDWMDDLDDKARDRCYGKLKFLEQYGHELRRPHAEYLRDGIYELRIKHFHVQFRILYFFHGQEAVVVSHGLAKEDRVPPEEIEFAVRHKRLFLSNPKRFSWEDLQ